MQLKKVNIRVKSRLIRSTVFFVEYFRVGLLIYFIFFGFGFLPHFNYILAYKFKNVLVDKSERYHLLTHGDK